MASLSLSSGEYNKEENCCYFIIICRLLASAHVGAYVIHLWKVYKNCQLASKRKAVSAKAHSYHFPFHMEETNAR